MCIFYAPDTWYKKARSTHTDRWLVNFFILFLVIIVTIWVRITHSVMVCLHLTFPHKRRYTCAPSCQPARKPTSLLECWFGLIITYIKVIYKAPAHTHTHIHMLRKAKTVKSFKLCFVTSTPFMKDRQLRVTLYLDVEMFQLNWPKN